MSYRINSKEERAKILEDLVDSLIQSGCEDINILKNVDRLCRRTWHDIHHGWVRWRYFLEKYLDYGEYERWAKENCKLVKE